MTGFGSLYYTDCVPGQGLQGGAGFQFQAATPGAATEAMHVVQRSTLYEPPAAWMRDRRPVTDYPRSLAHTVEDGFFATAAGRYLGQEANGTRQGNQFTHAVVTQDPAAYGIVRPAQLWAAGWWAQSPADGTSLPELPPDPVPGPLDVETVRERVAKTPEAEGMLTTLVSALQYLSDPERRRTVVLVTEEPERAACWVAAATLLLPSPQALRVSFKIFVTDVQYVRQDVVALHPDWAGRWADTHADTGLVVLDLHRGRCSTVQSTAAASFWVPRFLHADPYDVVDAVEMTGQFAAARARAAGDAGAGVVEPTAADRLVAVVAGARESLESADVSAVAEWLRAAPEEALALARDDALRAVLVTQPPAGVLRTLAAAVAGGVWEPAAVHRVLDGLLVSELNEVVDAVDGLAALRAGRAHEPLRPPNRAGHDRAEAYDATENALRAAAPDRVPALLTVAWRHQVDPRPNAFAETADHFARWWIRQTDPELAPDRWGAPEHVVDWARAVLREELQDRQRSEWAEAVVRDRWWRPLAGAVHDPSDRLDRVVWSAMYLHAKDDSVATQVRQEVLDACRLRYADVEAGANAWRIVTRFHDAPGLPECLAFLRELDDRSLPLSEEVAKSLEKVADRQDRLSLEGLRLARVLHEHGHRLLPDLDDQRVRDEQITEMIKDIRATTAGREPKDIATALNAVSKPMLALRLTRIVDALVAAPSKRAAAVLCEAGRARFRAIGDGLERRWPRPGRPPTEEQARAAALVFVVTGQGRGQDQINDFGVLRNRLAQCIGQLDKDERAPVFRALPRDLRDEWAVWLKEHEPSRFKRSLNKMTGGFLGESGKGKG